MRLGKVLVFCIVLYRAMIFDLMGLGRDEGDK
jgi:hypothetical protein